LASVCQRAPVSPLAPRRRPAATTTPADQCLAHGPFGPRYRCSTPAHRLGTTWDKDIHSGEASSSGGCWGRSARGRVLGPTRLVVLPGNAARRRAVRHRADLQPAHRVAAHGPVRRVAPRPGPRLTAPRSGPSRAHLRPGRPPVPTAADMLEHLPSGCDTAARCRPGWAPVPGAGVAWGRRDGFAELSRGPGRPGGPARSGSGRPRAIGWTGAARPAARCGPGSRRS